MISILLADDHDSLRKVVIDLLLGESDFQVIGDARNGKEALTLSKDLKPDILVTDLYMNGVNGIEVIREVKKCSPKTRIIVLSFVNTIPYVREALNTGAKGYVFKDDCFNTLPGAIREVFKGNCYLSPPLSLSEIESYDTLTRLPAQGL